MELKSIGIMSAAKVSAVLGLIYGVVMAIVILAGGSMAGVAGLGMMGAAMGAVGAVMAIVVGLIGGFISGAIGAFLYNIVAKYVGGVQLDLK